MIFGIKMSPQLIEIIIFAGIAIVIIGKFLSTLGSYDEEDPMRNKSYFGEKNNSLKDVTNNTKTPEEVINISKYLDIEKYLDKSNIKDIREGINQIESKLGFQFDIKGFIQKSKVAFELILDSLKNNDEGLLSHLVDKRFIQKLQQQLYIYKDLEYKEDIDSIITEIYSFGNNCFIKIKFSNFNKKFNEDWVFSKSSQDNTKTWYLSNIERD
jgi:predicted lipid-binding transport protein (Tim44 family)